MFSTAHVPGTDVGDDPAAEVPPPGQPTEHVALIRVVLDRVELLDIASRPHERVRFARAAGGWVGGRIAP
jgi:pyridoxine/pyridoxamine 5'-phosphate oxidase